MTLSRFSFYTKFNIFSLFNCHCWKLCVTALGAILLDFCLHVLPFRLVLCYTSNTLSSLLFSPPYLSCLTIWSSWDLYTLWQTQAVFLSVPSRQALLLCFFWILPPHRQRGEDLTLHQMPELQCCFILCFIWI